METRFVRIEHPDDKIVEEAVFTMIRRSQEGIKKFGCDMAKANMNVRAALVNAREEAMDQVIYISKAIYELDKPNSPEPHTRPCECADCSRKPKRKPKGHFVPHLGGYVG